MILIEKVDALRYSDVAKQTCSLLRSDWEMSRKVY